ncbi:CheR family methyltransferase [Actinoplanes aureus]|uniref:Methyltransferase domain-containing protein n=1 Tax=Actinoplanes aureus TaxID=2792083 RepID=A0A931G1A0_9ACTN|nr:CheR family methyltransferase [Actinoplanes aureus]MBG0562154.1 methyltransferase domain-containing protein [Actinoplanes aureus]
MIGGAELTRFRELLQRRLGWTFADSDGGQTMTVLEERAAAHSLSARGYLDRLGGRRWAAEIAELAEALSITETYFFRHSEQFRVLADRVLPERIAARAGQRVLRLLSVGCSSGEEAYSLAIVAGQARPGRDWIVSVLGVDANRQVLAQARAATYSSWSLRETPPEIQRRWFEETEDGFRVADEIVEMVRFAEQNVAVDEPQLWQPGRYDVIFCRNLLMYLTSETASGLITRMTRALAPGGYLFLGHTDSLGSHPEGLEMRYDGDTVHYRRPEPEPAPARRPAPRAAPPVEPAPAPEGDVHERAFGLMIDDRFAEALTLLDRHHPSGTRDLLLRGVLLAQLGRLAEARAAAHRLMDVGGPHPDAHHLLGVCHELDCAEQAAGQYRLAAYLDPAFAMPRLRMGLLARRRGDHRGAVVHLQPALELLAREDEERITLFGGGFGRLALTTLCRTELDACGVRP